MFDVIIQGVFADEEDFIRIEDIFQGLPLNWLSDRPLYDVIDNLGDYEDEKNDDYDDGNQAQENHFLFKKVHC